jgi:hypothetical protein
MSVSREESLHDRLVRVRSGESLSKPAPNGKPLADPVVAAEEGAERISQRVAAVRSAYEAGRAKVEKRYTPGHALPMVAALVGDLWQDVESEKRSAAEMFDAAESRVAAELKRAGLALAEAERADEARVPRLIAEYAAAYSAPDNPPMVGTVLMRGSETEIGGSILRQIEQDLELALEMDDRARVLAINREGRDRLVNLIQLRPGENLLERESERAGARAIVDRLDQFEAERVAPVTAVRERHQRLKAARRLVMRQLDQVERWAQAEVDAYHKERSKADAEKRLEETRQNRARIYGGQPWPPA